MYLPFAYFIKTTQYVVLFFVKLLHTRDEIRSANLALISGRQMHYINACIFLVAITKKRRLLSTIFSFISIFTFP